MSVIDWPWRELEEYGPLRPKGADWPEECEEVPEWVRPFVDDDGHITLSQEFYLAASNEEADNGWPLAYGEWRTESVWLDRLEAEAWGKVKAHRWTDGWRVYGVCAEGDLAELLRGDRLNSIADLARQYNHPGVSPAAHELANRVLELATGEGREYR
jgi:hypothetical protein